ncbi:hypothetical protein [Neisseria animaloris]|uniref:Uncharacterized protein n=1 Tax=Neisseria animaloris TaxID=326522 RepID=A0A3S4YBR3_9NEIS|nr:hypothetical protein [Neisseria animaloris]VEJ21995.1 Uncharacterised protein [Neisseria animaloris]
MKNFIQSLENEFVEKNQEKTTFSIRLSVKEDLILQEIAESFDLSRQELLHRLITEQIIVPWKKRFEEQANEELEEVDAEQSTQYFLLNTNKVNDIDDHDFMLEKQVAAAFEDGYKEKIAKFKKGDWVFLYESGQGIVAFGQASGKLEKAPHYGREDKTYYQRLEGFTRLSKAIKASEVKRILNRSFPFAQTLARIADGEKLLSEVKK